MRNRKVRIGDRYQYRKGTIWEIISLESSPNAKIVYSPHGTRDGSLGSIYLDEEFTYIENKSKEALDFYSRIK